MLEKFIKVLIITQISMVFSRILNSLNKTFFTYMARQEKINRFVSNNKYSKKISRRWIAGETLEEVLKVAEELNLENRLVSLDHLGEDIANEEDTRTSALEYIRILSDTSHLSLRSNVSLKLTQMGLDVDEELCYDNVDLIVRVAKSFHNFVRIDMEGSPHTQRTIDMYKRLRKDYDNVGIALQSYLYRTESDLDDLLKLGTNFRICKGAYREHRNIAFPKKKDVDKNFIKLSEKLLLSGIYQAFATHDKKMIGYIKNFAKAKNINKDKFEFQMLYGVRRELQQELVDGGYNLRVYVPYGKEWYPYTMRRFAESWHNVWFMLKDIF